MHVGTGSLESATCHDVTTEGGQPPYISNGDFDGMPSISVSGASDFERDTEISRSEDSDGERDSSYQDR